ncbi:Rpn family recombination-promoting nuclease/putative transposase [Pseudogracilibacillus sp. SO30301A]|uniref:Rpn family recombination-promoting nuclease/putative transposase n=1 Tax=Pseudogracilibacillus sp. SO30301A TaxID=3098291 RepID=UPI00300E3BD2
MTSTIVKEDVSRYSLSTHKKIEHPHDKFFKETFSHVEVTKSFLLHYLPPDVTEILDIATLKPEKDSFINKELEEGFSDLLFSADIDGRKGYIYFLFEHKSYPDKTVVFQLLKYMTKIWSTKMKKEKMDQVPLVIPLLIYHGLTPWNREKTLGGMISGYGYFPPGIRKFVPEYAYLVYDITNYKDEEIKGEARVQILFMMFRDVQKAKNVQELLKTIDKAIMYLQELEDKQTGVEYFETFMRYIFSAAKNLTREDTDEIVEKVETTYPEGSELVMTLAESWREEGVKVGIKEGIKEGKISVVKNALKEGMELHLIEKLTGLSRKEIEKIAEEMEK